MKKKTISVLLAVTMAIGCMNLAGCGESEAAGEESAEEIIEVEAVSPEVGNIAVQTEFMGTLEPQDETNVFAKMSGEVTETFFEVGDFVNAGDVLFTLDDEAAQLQMETAQASYAQAQAGVSQQLGAMQMNRDSAANSLQTAQEGISQITDSYNYMADQYGDLESTKSDAMEDRDDLKDDKKDTKKKLKDAKAGLADAQSYYNQVSAEYNEAIASGASEEIIAALKEKMSDAADVVGKAQTAVSTLQSAVASMESGIKQYDASIDQLESSQKALGNQMGNLNYSYAQAQRGANLAQEGLDYYDNYTAPATKQSADATMKQVQVALDSAQMQLDFTKITAPVSGVIEQKNVDKYGMAQAGMPAYVITNKDKMMASFKVTEAVLKTLSVGQEVLVERNGNTFSGKISELPLTIDSASGLFEIKAVVDGSPAELTSGTAVKITTTTDHQDNVLTLPVDCVYYDTDKAYIYVVKNGVVAKNYISVGLFDADNIQVIDGVDTDATVVSSWSADLRDGLKVTTVAPKAETDKAE